MNSVKGNQCMSVNSLNSSYFYQFQIKSLSAIKIWQEINVKITSIQDQYINVIFYWFLSFRHAISSSGNLKFACLTIKRLTGGQDQFLCCMLIGIFAAPTILSQMNPICEQVCGCGVLYHWGQLLFNYHTSHTWTKTSYMTYSNFPTNPSFLLYLITFISVYHILISWMYLSKHWKL